MSYIARQPNGLLCRFSSMVDAVTHINMSEEDYIEMCAERAREEAKRDLEDKRFVKSFDCVLEDIRFDTMTYDEWQGCLKEMGYDGPEMPFKFGDKVRLVNQSDADMDGRKAVVERSYRNNRTGKIDVEIRFDDEQDATYMYNDYDLEKEKQPMNDANKYSLQNAKSLDDLATRICGFGYYANHNDDRDHPIPKEAVKEYLEVGAAFQMKETEPKLQKLKKLADAMYRAAQYLTTDTSHLRKAMDEYHQFIIQNKI